MLAEVQSPYPPAERLLYSFGSSDDLARWKVFTDQQYGGRSTAELASSPDEPVSAKFASNHGTALSEIDRSKSSMHSSSSSQ